MINKFKTIIGLNPSDNIPELIANGIDEVYCGYYDNEFNKKWPVAFTTVNRRGEGVNFSDFNLLTTETRKLYKHDIKSYITLNGYYTQEQYPWLIKNIKKIAGEHSIDGVIVNDIGILLLLKKLKFNKNITISTLATPFNDNAVEFYQKLGSTRIVLDRQLSLSEIKKIVNKYPKLEFEIFVVSTGGCLFIDGYCSFFHCLEETKNKQNNKNIMQIEKYDITTSGAGCCELLNDFSQQLYRSTGNKKHDKFNLAKTMGFNCNICMLYGLKSIKNISLKVDSRGSNGTGVTNINMLKTLLKAVNDCKSNKEYIASAKKVLMKIKKVKCNPKICLCGQL